MKKDKRKKWPKNHPKRYAFPQALYDGDFQLAKEALEDGANINVVCIDKYTALTNAVWGRKDEIISFLLKHGADPFLEDGYGHSAWEVANWIFEAKHHNSEKVLKMLEIHIQQKELDAIVNVSFNNNLNTL